jgi:uncharacterized OsmC-like protein
MVEILIEYEGDLHCRASHGPSRKELQTDAPIDNQGKGESFSPTDLLATALGTCMMTTMGIYAKRHNIDLKGAMVRVEKHMSDNPRRIGKLIVEFKIPIKPDEKQRQALENAALTCPVHKSLDPEIEIPIHFHYPEA